MERLGRDSLTTAEWMAEAGVTDAKEYKKILKVCSLSAMIGKPHEIACCECRGGCVSLLRCTMCTHVSSMRHDASALLFWDRIDIPR